MSPVRLPLSIRTTDSGSAIQSEPLRTIVTEIVRVALPEQVILFGSRATQTASPESDYDFLVIVPDVQNERQVSRRIYRALLDRKVGVAVDVIVVGAKTLEQNRARPYSIYHQALEGGQVLYGHARA